MGRMPVGVGPSLFAGEQRSGIGESSGRHQSLEGCKPVFIIMRTVIRFAPVGGGFEFIGESSRPFFPGEMPLVGKFYCQRECLRLPGLREYRSALVARKLRQRC